MKPSEVKMLLAETWRAQEVICERLERLRTVIEFACEHQLDEDLDCVACHKRFDRDGRILK